MYYLKRKFKDSRDQKERRKASQDASCMKKVSKKRKNERSGRYITSPLVRKTKGKKQRKMIDYSVNVRVVISSFYVGTGDLDVGLDHSYLGMKGGKNW